MAKKITAKSTPDDVIRYLKAKTGKKVEKNELLNLVKELGHGPRADLKEK